MNISLTGLKSDFKINVQNVVTWRHVNGGKNTDGDACTTRLGIMTIRMRMQTAWADPGFLGRGGRTCARILEGGGGFLSPFFDGGGVRPDP